MTSKEERENEKRLAVLAQLMTEPANKQCADCCSKGPRWTSWSLGLFLCINCAGIHRSLGTHITRVKSATLDKWTDEQVLNMQRLGNARGKEIYEALVPVDYNRPTEGSSAHAIENWIKAKYEKKQFMRKGGAPVLHTSTPPNSPSTRSSDGERRKRRQEKERRRREVAEQSPQVVSTPVAAPAPVKALIDFDAIFSSAPSAPMQSPQQQHLFQPPAVPIESTQRVPTPYPPAPSTSTPSNFLSEMMFNQASSATPAKVDKEAIMSLYATPMAPTPGVSIHPAYGHMPNTSNPFMVMQVPQTWAPTAHPMMYAPSGPQSTGAVYPMHTPSPPLARFSPQMGAHTPLNTRV